MKVHGEPEVAGTQEQRNAGDNLGAQRGQQGPHCDDARRRPSRPARLQEQRNAPPIEPQPSLQACVQEVNCVGDENGYEAGPGHEMTIPEVLHRQNRVEQLTKPIESRIGGGHA